MNGYKTDSSRRAYPLDLNRYPLPQEACILSAAATHMGGGVSTVQHDLIMSLQLLHMPTAYFNPWHVRSLHAKLVDHHTPTTALALDTLLPSKPEVLLAAAESVAKMINML
jgi:hypothetical protein